MGLIIIGLMPHCSISSLIDHHIVWDIALKSCIQKKYAWKHIFFTIVNGKKSKGHSKGLQNFGVLPYLWVDENGKTSKSSDSRTRKRLKLLCQWTESLKFSNGYIWNISCCCNVKECKFFVIKMCDCHIFLQNLYL